MKIIQVNILSGKYLKNLISFLLDEKPDAVTMQEVTLEAFETICKQTDLIGYLDKTTPFARSDGSVFFGNAALIKGDIVKKNVVRLNDYFQIMQIEKIDIEKVPRSLLDLLVVFGGYRFHLISTHLAVRRDTKDSKEKIKQADTFSNYIRTLGKEPFIIGADLNAIPGSRVVEIIDNVARNSFYSFKIRRTTHPILHKTKKLFPEGLVIDYIYTSKHFMIKSLKAKTFNISDHLPLIAEVELVKS